MMGEHTLTTTHTQTHTSGYKKVKDSMHLAVKECQLNKMWATKRRGKKYPGKFEALIRELFGENAPRKASFWPWRYGTSRCMESKLSLADTASSLLVSGNGHVHTCHYYLRVGFGAQLGLTSLGCISLPRLRAILVWRWLWFGSGRDWRLRQQV